jgi:NlpC/P60 family/S-layer homology domain
MQRIGCQRSDVSGTSPLGSRRHGLVRGARRSLVTLALLAGLLAILMCGTAAARQYRDVASSSWASQYIGQVTSRVISGQQLMDDYGADFKPAKAITRAQLARLLVLLAGKYGTSYSARDLADVPADNAYYGDIQLAIKYGLLGTQKDGFHPDDPALLWQFDRALIRVTKLRNPRTDWTMLTSLASGEWEPNPGWKPRPPSYFATEIAARWLEYRYNHHGQADALELSVVDPVRRSDVAYSVYKLLTVSSWRLQGLSHFNRITLPQMSARQREIAAFAFKWVGYPHIYGGEYPTKDSPYGYQLHGGFDCSGFTWWVLKMTFKYPIPLGERSAAQMAGGAKPRITRAKLQPLDLLFWGPQGPKSSVASIYHAGLYLGNGWFIQSTGSSGGVSLASLDWSDWAWKTDFAWGRRVLKKSELGTSTTTTTTASPSPSPSPSVSPSVSPSPSPSPVTSTSPSPSGTPLL